MKGRRVYHFDTVESNAAVAFYFGYSIYSYYYQAYTVVLYTTNTFIGDFLTFKFVVKSHYHHTITTQINGY